MQATQSVILETSRHTMRAIDGNKAPLREWVGRMERCRNSGGEDCGTIKKVPVEDSSMTDCEAGLLHVF